MCLAVPGRVESVHAADGARMGRVSFGGVVRDVCLEFLPEAGVGDYVLVHVGVAISRVDEDTARETLAAFAAMGDPDDAPPPDG